MGSPEVAGTEAGSRGLAGRIGAATVRMDRVLDGLRAASPEELEGCTGLIELACQDLAGFLHPPGGTRQQAGVGGEAGTLAATLYLRNQIRQARRLLESVYRFHSRWGQLLGARTGGYLPDGQAAPVLGASRLSLRG